MKLNAMKKKNATTVFSRGRRKKESQSKCLKRGETERKRTVKVVKSLEDSAESISNKVVDSTSLIPCESKILFLICLICCNLNLQLLEY